MPAAPPRGARERARIIRAAHAHARRATGASFRKSLPAAARRSRRLCASTVVIVCGETGSGKTTQLPKIALALGRGRARRQLIGHTQPRRIAAPAVASASRRN